MKSLRPIPTLLIAGLLALTAGCSSTSSTASGAGPTTAAASGGGMSNSDLPDGPGGPDDGQGDSGGSVQSQSLTLQRDDIQLAATLDVPAAAQDQQVPLVLLLHGLGGSQDDEIIQTTAAALNNAGMATLRIDFDGHGSSGGDLVDMTVPGEIKDAQAAYEYARTLSYVSSVALVGHSQGGVVAAMLAGQLGDEISAMALLAPASTIPQMARDGNFLGTEFDPGNPPETISVGGLELGRQYILTAQKLALTKVSAQYTGPVLVIQGEDDDVLSVSSAQAYESVFSDAQLQVLSGEDHEFSADPSQPASLVSQFLAAGLE